MTTATTAAALSALQSITVPKRSRTTPASDTTSAVGYLRVSTADQAESGAGIAAQRTAITAYAERQGFTVTSWHTDAGVSGSAAPHERPGLTAALTEVMDGNAARLIVAKVDRLSRRLRDSINLMELAREQGWPLMFADIDADLATSQGRFTAQLWALMAENERDLIRTRTRDALAEKRAAGVRLGRPSTLPREVVARVMDERDAGTGWQRIANGLMADQIPTARGGDRWHANSVRQVYNGQDAAQIRTYREQESAA